MRLQVLWRDASIATTLAALTACASAGGTSLAPGVLGANTVSRTTVKITAYTVPTNGVNPYDIALGIGNNLYITQPILNQGAGSSTYLWQISEAGHFTRLQPQLGGTGPIGIARGSGGTVYFGLEHNGGTIIGSYDGGKVHFRNAGPSVNAVYFLALAADGSLWFSDPGDFQVGHIVKNKDTLYSAPTKYCSPYGITIGSDKNVWVAEQCPAGTGKIGKITPSGKWSEIALPTQSEQPFGIVAGPDHNLWYTGGFTNDIGRITTGGKITEFPLNHVGMGFGSPYLIAVGNDKALWFTVQESNQIGRITTSGSATETPIPGCGAQCTVTPGGIAAGLGSTIWFTNVTGNQVEKVAY